jgi:hypothetical protein
MFAQRLRSFADNIGVRPLFDLTASSRPVIPPAAVTINKP